MSKTITVRQHRHYVFEIAAWIVHKEVLSAVVTHLVKSSCWFEVTPLPKDQYEVAVKSDRIAVLTDCPESARTIPIVSKSKPENLPGINAFYLHSNGRTGDHDQDTMQFQCLVVSLASVLKRIGEESLQEAIRECALEDPVLIEYGSTVDHATEGARLACRNAGFNVIE